MRPTKESVNSGDHSFSCRCGWIDWGHASPSEARTIKDRIRCEPELDLGSPDYKVIDIPTPLWANIFGLVSIPIYQAGGLAVVGRHLSEQEQKQVALGIFMAVEEQAEDFQLRLEQWSLTKSGYSLEDLSSDLIGFYVAWETDKGISPDQLRQLVGLERHPPCYVLNIKDSVAVFEAFEKGGFLDEKNREWKPYQIPSGCDSTEDVIKEKCRGMPTGWPEQYARVMPEPGRKEGKWWWWEGLGTGEQLQPACCRGSHKEIEGVFYYFPCVFPCGSVP
jgi:hypothetical protein